MKLFEKLVLGLLCLVVLVFFVLIGVQPTRRYKLPTGKIITCGSFEESSKGNYILKSCDDGIEYYTNGTIEVLP